MRSKTVAIFTFALLAVAAGCGGGGDERPTVPPNPTSTPRPTAVPSPTATATAVPTATPEPTPTPTPSPTPTPTPVAPDAAFFAIFDLAGRLGVGPNTISIVSYDEVSWPSSAYGCPEPGTFYLPVVSNGWDIRLSADGQIYEYHTDDTGDVLIDCTESRALAAQSINIVELADLRTTNLIEMRRRVGDDEFVLKSTVTEPGEIEAIVDILDVPVLLRPADECTEVFRLVFITSSGAQTIGTICRGNTRLIRGDQGFWSGQDADAPPEFSSIIGPYFADEPLPTIPS